MAQGIGPKYGPMGSMGPFNPTDTFEPFVDQDDMNEIVVKSNEDVIGELSSN